MGIHHTPDDYSQDVQSCAGETASVSEDSGVVSASSLPQAPLMAAVLSTTDNDNNMTSTTASTSQENAPSTQSSSSSSSPGPMAVPLAPPCNYDDEEDETDEDETDADNNSTTTPNDNDTPLPYSRIRFPSNESQLTTHHPGADVAELAAYRPHIWYQYEELKSMKRTALALAKEAQRLSQGSLLTHTYGRATSPDSQHALVAWACLGQTRRGLERWINEEYAAKRSDIRQRTIQSVIRAQAKLKENTTKHDNNSSSSSSPPDDTTDVDYSIKVLARLSEAFSVDSRQFARSMGLADEKAAQEALQQTDTTISEEPLTHRQSIRNASSSSTTTTASYAPSSPAKKRLSLTGGSHHSTKSSHPSSRVVPKPPRRPGQRTTATSTTSTNRRRGGLTAPSVSADFRHYY